MNKENINVRSESHIKITDITDKKNPKTIISKRLFNKKTKINITDTKTK